MNIICIPPDLDAVYEIWIDKGIIKILFRRLRVLFRRLRVLFRRLRVLFRRLRVLFRRLRVLLMIPIDLEILF